MLFSLRIETKEGGTLRALLDKPVIRIGRLESNDVVLSDPNVSRIHAKMFMDQNGIEIEDQGSKNFTFVNGETVTRKRVDPGDIIAIGENTLVLERGTAEAVIDLALSGGDWGKPDGSIPQGLTILSPEAFLEKGKESLHSDLGRLVQIYRFSQRISENIRDHSMLIEEIARATHRMFEADLCALTFVSGSGDAAQTYVFPPPGVEDSRAERDLLPEEVRAQMENQDKSFLIRFSPSRDAHKDLQAGTYSIMCAPLLSHGDRIGHFYIVRDRRKGDFSRWDLEYLTAVANLAGVALTNARSYRKALDENQRYEDVLQSKIQFIGRSQAMQEVGTFVRKVAPSDASVLINGESGTGKELVARAIHAFSSRRMFRFIPINCAAIPDNLLESELFGVETGAYTDARKKIGRIELAHRGTLFLDEISDMNIVLQSKLLRVLQYKEFERLGGIETLCVDVRIIAATNRDIWKEVLEGRFRNDLLYRIQVIKLNLPPLRERREDIPVLANHFLQRYAEKNGTCTKKISKQAMDLLIAHSWPGNVRELENAIEAALVMSNDWILWPDDLPEELRSGGGEKSSGYPTMQEMEKEHIVRTVRFCSGNKKKTSQMLGITRQTLDNKLTKYGIKI
jgi:two-component system, NtrC family, response regulator HydG